MNSIKLDQLEPELSEFLEERSRRTGKPPSEVAKDLLRQAAGISSTPSETIGNRLDYLAGGWTKQEAEEFEKATESCERIDPPLWQ